MPKATPGKRNEIYIMRQKSFGSGNYNYDAK
jgi:hypothetical protein